MNHAVRIHTYGGPEVLRWEEVALPAPGPGEALVRQTAVGVNFIDTYHRSGLYPMPSLPSGIGSEAAGVVEAVGAGVTEVAPGDRVAYAGGPPGSYAERRVMPAARLVPLPRAIDERTAAAALLKGMTVEYLVCRTYPVRAGETVLLHAAAGGVGLIACQWLRQPRGDGDRDRLHGGEGGTRAGPRLRAPGRDGARGLRGPRARADAAAAACRSCTTPSGATPSCARSTASPRAG